jgi:hypothetical protein
VIRHAAKLALIALCGLAPLVGVGVAGADPGSNCSFHDQRLCHPDQVTYCPDTGTQVTFMQLCPSLVIGPHQAGMPDD